jgi:hypothetical protein
MFDGRGLSRAAGGFFIAVALAISGCGPLDPKEEQAGPCQGKCDGLSSTFKDWFSDMRKVDLGDLINVGAELATKQVNDQLGAVPYTQIELQPTELYASSARAQQDLTLHDLEQLASGLAARYGDKAFVTRVNALRAAYLQQHPNAVFAEASFEVGGKLKPNFEFDVAGLEGRVGFLGAKGIETTVIAPYNGELQAVLGGPIKALKELRGFAVPRDVDDIAAMVPGETLTMSSDGAVGLNIGLGLPIYIATIESAATLHAVVSAAARATMGGRVDIQLIREEGQAVVVDVGLTGQNNKFFKLAVKTAWGVEALAEYRLEIGPISLDLAQMAERALEDLLNRKLSVVSAGYINDEEQIRHTVARFSFDLGRRDEALEQALIQAMRGDVRLAQSLAQRPGSGVAQLLDLTRDARSLSSYLGVRFLSLHFFRQKKDREGNVVITTGPDSQQILFDELDRQSGFFFTSRGYKRRSVVSIRSHQGRLVDADFNLRVQLRESDRYTDRDQVLDHVDPLLAQFIGSERLNNRIAPITDALERYVDAKCPKPFKTGGKTSSSTYNLKMQKYRECLKLLPVDAQVVNLRTQAQGAFSAVLGEGIQGGFDPAFDDAASFAQKLFALKLEVQSSYEYPALWTGPRSNLVIDYRLTDQAITSLLATADGPDRFAKSLREALYLLRVERDDPQDDKVSAIQKKLQGLASEIEQARKVVSKRGGQYQRLVNLATISYESQAMGQTSVGDQAHLVVVQPDGSGTSLATIAERKASKAAQLFDDLVDKAEMGVPEHQAIGYALLGCVHPSQLELLVNLDFEKSTYADYPDVRLYGRGQQAKLIDAGQFDLDALVGE